MLARFIYLGYYMKNLSWGKFSLFLEKTSKEQRTSKLNLVLKIIGDSLKYNISILEFFQFRFFEKAKHEKSSWAGTGYMYEYQKIMNPKKHRHILDDKTLFYKVYGKYFVHNALDINDMKKNTDQVAEMLKIPQVVLKESKGKCGLGTTFVESKDFTPESLIEFMQKEGYDLAETFIEQHHALQSLSPSGVNTVRIFTQLNKDNEVEILGCRQRISVNSPIDNLAAGNLAAPIDEKTGIITGPGVYSDITKLPEEVHPITKIKIRGFQIPFWQECIQLAKNAALEHPQNRSIGWDIVVTSQGPGLIEGNHDWCKLVWQLPVNRGLKPMLEKHLLEYNS